jgi:uncharacterized protein
VKLFVDTSGWIGLSDKSDKYHARAAAAFASLAGRPCKFITTDYVLDETITRLTTFCSHTEAAAFGRWALASPFIEIIHIDEPLWQAAWEMFQIYDDKVWSFTDCASFVVMRQWRLHQAFAFDRHFRQAGFQLWPGVNNG